MLSALPVLLCASMSGSSDVCPELRSMRTEILHLHRHRGSTNVPMVSDARLAQVERKLGEFLGLPAQLRVRMTTITGHRREMAKPDLLSMIVEDRSSGIGVGSWSTPWSGECLSQGGLRFSRGASGSSAHCSLHASARHYPRELLARMFEEVGATTEAIEAASLPVERLLLRGGGAQATPPFVVAQASLRLEYPPGEAVVSAEVQLRLGELEPDADDRAEPPHLHELLTVGVELLGAIELAAPHSIQLRVASMDRCTLTLDPYERGHPALPLWATLDLTEKGWSVSNRSGQLERGAVPLATFSRLAAAVVEITQRRKERVGVLGIALDSRPDEVVACVVTVDADSIWEAERGRLHLVRLSAGVATVAREAELLSFEQGDGMWNARKATSDEGEEFYVEGRAGDIFTSTPTPPILRFDERAFAVLGGRVMR